MGQFTGNGPVHKYWVRKQASGEFTHSASGNKYWVSSQVITDSVNKNVIVGVLTVDKLDRTDNTRVYNQVLHNNHNKI